MFNDQCNPFEQDFDEQPIHPFPQDFVERPMHPWPHDFVERQEESESVNRRTESTMVKKRGQKDKQRPTKHTHKTKDRVKYNTPFLIRYLHVKFYLYTRSLYSGSNKR